MIQENDNSVVDHTMSDARDAVAEESIKVIERLIYDISSVPKHYFNDNFDFAHMEKRLHDTRR